MAKIKGREMQTQGQHSDVLSKRKLLSFKDLGSKCIRISLCNAGKP